MITKCEICSIEIESNQMFKHIHSVHPVKETINLKGIQEYKQSEVLVGSRSDLCILRDCAVRVDEAKQTKDEETFVPRLRIRLSATTDPKQFQKLTEADIKFGVFLCASHFLEGAILEEVFVQFGMAQTFHPKLDLSKPKRIHVKNRPLFQMKKETLKIFKTASETLSVIVKENAEGENGKGKNGERRRKRLSKYLKKMKFENVLLKDQVKEKFVENVNLSAEKENYLKLFLVEREKNEKLSAQLQLETRKSKHCMKQAFCLVNNLKDEIKSLKTKENEQKSMTVENLTNEIKQLKNENKEKDTKIQDCEKKIKWDQTYLKTYIDYIEREKEEDLNEKSEFEYLIRKDERAKMMQEKNSL